MWPLNIENSNSFFFFFQKSKTLLPFSNGSTFDNIMSKVIYNSQQVEVQFYSLIIANYTPANNSDLISVTLGLAFYDVPSVNGRSCQVTMNKAPNEESEEFFSGFISKIQSIFNY